MKCAYHTISSVACWTLPYFSTLFRSEPQPVQFYLISQHFITNSMIFRKGYWTYMCILNFLTTFVWNISHSKKNSVRCYHKCTSVFTQRTCYSRQSLMKHKNFPNIFLKNIRMSNFTKIHPVGAKLLYVDWQGDRQTDMTKLITVFCSVARLCTHTQTLTHSLSLSRSLQSNKMWSTVCSLFLQKHNGLSRILHKYKAQWTV